MSKYVSILMITAGIITCTYSSTSSKSVEAGDEEKEESWIMVGISLLTFALFMSARMGIYQEVVYSKHGKHPREALFYTHALPLPGFLLLAPDILNHWNIVLSSPPLPILPMVPSMLLSLLFSIWYFSNPFTTLHWLGTALVFGGTLV